MKGSFEVRVSRRRGTRYQFTIKRNITIVRGDSGTGKTTLYDMVADHMRYGGQSGVAVECERPCVALTDADWRTQLSGFSNSIVFIDEGFKDLLSHDFAAAVRGSSNYYVLITRADVPSLPYSIDEIYRVKTSGKYHSLVPLYRRGEGLRYPASAVPPKTAFETLLCEDSKSGYQFYSRRFEGTSVSCESAGSNAGVLTWLRDHPNARAFVVADGAAFGPFADRVLKLQSAQRGAMVICLPESFEWLLLKASLRGLPDAGEVLENPQNYVESSEYMSWERFFTAYLKDLTRGTAFEYKKELLAEPYVCEPNASKIMQLITCGNIR